ncbi:hepatitis A virus cellular receptor 1-like isoform X1 [Phycodurus eques]|uniref:hepatitis A virus cellular receptor 1-like isoform X1 n=1 Tax=Phycodurus eques TaxID=693459 RepID=UPI002ACD2A8A|nr:hepatitis A virus cellular receptor 1-like isoform X1 [Phycodurus eques]
MLLLLILFAVSLRSCAAQISIPVASSTATTHAAGPLTTTTYPTTPASSSAITHEASPTTTTMNPTMPVASSTATTNVAGPLTTTTYPTTPARLTTTPGAFTSSVTFTASPKKPYVVFIEARVLSQIELSNNKLQPVLDKLKEFIQEESNGTIIITAKKIR